MPDIKILKKVYILELQDKKLENLKEMSLW